jgi:hypothetical protein
MPTRFAVATGNFSNGATWDNGAVPTSADDVYANNFTVTINGTYTVQTIRNTVSPLLVPNIATPAMTSNTTPSGTVFASSITGVNVAWNAFSQDNNFSTVWQSGTANTGILGYQFTSGKIIKRYIIKGYSLSAAGNPTAWTFQGSNDGTTYTTLETVTGASIPTNGNYTSGILANTTSYLYYRINITAVTTLGTAPYISEFEMTESTGTVLGGVANGQFIYANGGNLTCTATQAIVVGGALAPLEMNLASPNTATFNGNVTGMSNSFSTVIRLSGTGTLNCNGNYNIDGGGAGGRSIIIVAAGGTVNIVGDLTSSMTSGGFGTYALNVAGSGAVVNITGNVTGPAFAAGGFSTLLSQTAATINITGNVLGSGTQAVTLAGATILNIIGNVTASATQPGITNATTAATISVTGIITAGTGAPAIYAGFTLTSGYASGTYVKVSGNVVNSTNNMAIVAPRVTIDTNTSSWLFQISTGGNRILYAAGVALGNPATNNVRFGTTYGASSELTGTLRVPSPSNVLSGVLTDNTTGTLLMTPADFWNYLISSGFTANSIGDRLQNASTVATTGGQIASYNI